MRLSPCVALCVCLAACAKKSEPVASADRVVAPATLMSWNVQGASSEEPERLEAIGERIARVEPDFVALQECPGCQGQALGALTLVGSASSGVALAYAGDSWSLRDRGELLLGSNDDGWGDRFAVWGRFVHRETGVPVLVYSTHWCVPVRAGDDPCDARRQATYARRIRSHLGQFPGVDAAVAGDFNVWEGEGGSPLAELERFQDAYRSIHPDGEAHSFAGNHFANAGRVDYVLVSPGVRVEGAAPLPMPYVSDPHSDHRPIVTRVAFAAR